MLDPAALAVTTNAPAHSSGSGLPTWAWILIVLGAILALAAAAFSRRGPPVVPVDEPVYPVEPGPPPVGGVAPPTEPLPPRRRPPPGAPR